VDLIFMYIAVASLVGSFVSILFVIGFSPKKDHKIRYSVAQLRNWNIVARSLEWVDQRDAGRFRKLQISIRVALGFALFAIVSLVVSGVLPI
jgi:hypothetical protein